MKGLFREKAGFTIIEIIVVLVIAGVLAAIAAGYGRDAEIPPSTGLISAIKSLPRAIVAALRLQKYFVT